MVGLSGPDTEDVAALSNLVDFAAEPELRAACRLRPTTLRRASDHEVIQDGRRTWWAAEASSTRRETFAAFAERVRGATVSFDGATLSDDSGDRTLAASHERGCTVDGAAPLALPYDRVPAPFASTSEDGRQVTVAFGGHRLELDFGRATRTSSQP